MGFEDLRLAVEHSSIYLRSVVCFFLHYVCLFMFVYVFYFFIGLVGV